MAASFQLVVDCHDPATLAHFWAAALGYELAPPPDGHESWPDFFRSIGVPEDELGAGPDRIRDPDGAGPEIWFQVVPEAKTLKNRLHLDVSASGGRTHPLAVRRDRVEAVADRLAALGATRLRTLSEHGLDHYAVAMADPEGNEFDVF